MGDSGYKGISASQDSRFKNKESALLKSIKFPTHFDHKVDMKKVELDVIKPWIASRVTELLGFEDDVVLEYASGMLEEDRFPDPRKVQIQLTGFLESQTGLFMGELWTLLLSAQESPGGIPAIFVQQKKEELRLKREQDQHALREARDRAHRAGVDSRGAPDRRVEGGRWGAQGSYRQDERGPPRNPGRSGPPPPSFRDRNGQTADRSRDSGWGARSAPRPRDGRSPVHSPKRERDEEPPRYERRRRERSPSRSPRPSSSSTRNRDDRKEPRRRERSRSRSVTPDYRSEKRSRRSERNEDEPRRNRRRSSPHGSPEQDGDTTPKVDKPRRSSRRDRDDEDSDRHRRRRTSPSRSKWDEEDEDRKQHGRQDEREREREAELRAKLLRAKNSQT